MHDSLFEEQLLCAVGADDALLTFPVDAIDGDFGAYAGHVDPLLINPQKQYWGMNLPILSQIKAAVDPQDIFQNPQSVSVLEES